MLFKKFLMIIKYQQEKFTLIYFIRIEQLGDNDDIISQEEFFLLISS